MPKFDPAEMKVIADHLEEDEETSEMVTRMEREADEEISASTVTLRWGREQVDVVKRAAGIMGVPYQTYLKQVVFRQAVEDIERAQGVLGSRRKASRRAANPGGRTKALEAIKIQVESNIPIRTNKN